MKAKTEIGSVFRKGVSILLSMLMIIYMVPVTVWADMIDSIEPEEAAGNEAQATSDGIFELTERREENVKHYRLEDGSIMLVDYTDPVHRADENGEWQDIDNHLSLSGSEYASSDARVKFAKKTTGNGTLFTLHEHNRKIEMSLDGAAKKIEGVVTNTSTEFDEEATELQKLMTLDKLSARILYADILPGVDLEYVVVSNNIKENIIVKEKNESGEGYSYTFTLSLNNLEAEKTVKGDIKLYDPDTNEIVYTIPAGYMTDAAGAESYAVEYELTDLENGKYSLTIIPDKEWMDHESRVYPITVDPPIYTPYTASAIDLDMSSTSPDQISSSDQHMWVDSNWRGYWKLTSLPSLPNSAYITEAKLHIGWNAYNSQPASGYIGVYEVTTAWDENSNWTSYTNEGEATIASDYTDFAYFEAYQEHVDGNLMYNSTSYNLTITPLVKKWYDGSNFGVCFKVVDSSTFNGRARIYSSDQSTAALRPQLMVKYVDMKGIEDYYSYTSQSAGFAGTGSVNNATGGLTFSIPTLTTTDALMPITPTLVYNNAIAGVDYEYPNAQVSYNGAFAPRGYKLNLQETLLKQSFADSAGNTLYRFVWADGDGTEHYFLPTSTANTYADEDGLLLTLVEASNEVTITDSNKTVRSFSSAVTPSGNVSGWYLTSITDKTGNKLVFGFDSSLRITSVSLVPFGLSSIQQLVIAYDSNANPKYVLNPNSGEAVVFRYSSTYNGSLSTSGSNYLRRVIRAHGSTSASVWDSFYSSGSVTSTSTVTVDAVAEYTYTSTGRLSSVINNMSKYKLEYEYTGTKVETVTESTTATSTNNVGQKLGFQYSTTSTVIRTSGSDDIYNTTDDLLTTYGFDNYGRTISSYTTDLYRISVYGAAYGEYVDADENERAKNNIKSSVSTTQRPSNYIVNGDFVDYSGSSITGWTKSGNVAVLNDGYFRATVANLTVNSTTTTSSLTQPLYLYGGDYYLSAEVFADHPENVKLTLKVIPQSSGYNTISKEVFINNQDKVYSEVGMYFSIEDLPYPSNQFSIVIEATYVSGSGSYIVKVDNVMLSKGSGHPSYNMVTLGNFDEFTGFSPQDYWSYPNGSTEDITIVNTNSEFGNSLKLSSNVGEINYVSQEIYRNDNATLIDTGAIEKDMFFTVSAFAKGTGQAYNTTGVVQSSKFCIIATVNYYDIETNSYNSEYFTFDFDKGITDWQYLSGVFRTDTSKGRIASITISLYYQNNPGVCYFDEISVVENDSGLALYSYNTQGYVSSSSNGSNDALYYYDTDNNLKYAVYSDKRAIAYNYSANLLSSELEYTYTCDMVEVYNEADDIFNGGILKSTVQYEYDDYGNLEQTTLRQGFSSSEYLRTSTSYNNAPGSHIFGTVATETDSSGKTTRYFYDTTNGWLLGVVYPDNTAIYYGYDEIGNLTNVLPATYSESSGSCSAITDSASVEYTYDPTTKRLTSIKTESSTYNFTYDKFGNSSSINVGSASLASYEYNSNNGKLNTLTYGNGFKEKYVYDHLDRIVEIQYNTGSGGTYETVYKYAYTREGYLYSIEDVKNGETTLFYYDSNGRVVGSNVYNNDDLSNQYGSIVIYDEESRVSASKEYLNYLYSGSSSDTFKINKVYTYSGNELTKITADYGGTDLTITPTYDTLRRVIGMTYSFDDSFTNTVSYQFESVENDTLRTSNRISQMTGTLGSATYNYTYDDNGNITEIRDASNVIQNKYYYDNLGQLIREDNHIGNFTQLMSYDDAGNILGKEKIALTTGSVSTPTTNYLYGNTSWGDQLTAINGNAITYDSIGNPTQIGAVGTIGSATLTWQGTQLQSYIKYYYEIAEVVPQTITYTYNDEGIRTKKVVGNEVHEYMLNGSQIIAEKFGDKFIVYITDEFGSPIGLRYRTSSYAQGVFDNFYFEKNLQGDIVAIYNASGEKIGSYTYDAWGSHTAATVSGNTSLESLIVNDYNPFRYRGYYYDIDTELYYLQSRYYNPEWGRFLNADGYVNANGDILGYNMFAYCGNNPVYRADYDGEWWNVVIGAVVGGAISAINTYIQGGSKTEIFVSALCGAVSGGFAATGLGGVLGQMAVGTITSAIDSGYQNYNAYKEGEKTLGEAIGETLIDSALGATFGAMGAKGTTAFKESTKIANKTNKALSTLAKKGVHPNVREAAKKAIRQGRKYFIKEGWSTIVDNVSTTIASNFMSDIGGGIYKKTFG